MERGCNGLLLLGVLWAAAARIQAVQAQAAGAGIYGAWSGIINFPLIPVSAAQLPNSLTLLWSASYRDASTLKPFGQTWTAVWNSTARRVTAYFVNNTRHDMFCPGTALLLDGRVLVNGGKDSTKTSIYNASTNTWTSGKPMIIGRGYNADTVLINGNVFTVGGSYSGTRTQPKTAEIYDAANDTWRLLPGIPAGAIVTQDRSGIYRSDNHAWLFGLANGSVFHAGPSADMHIFSTQGVGEVFAAGPRADHGDAMNGNVVMFAPRKFLALGGSPSYDDSAATNRAFVISLDDNNNATVREVGSMAYARAFCNSVLMPDGRVIVFGGMPFAVTFNDTDAVLTPELWDPRTENFTLLTPCKTPRVYHSVALLQPDGTVLSAGGGLRNRRETVNHQNGEVFTPPNHFDENGTLAVRPSIVESPVSAPLGSVVLVTTDVEVASFALLRMGAVTHCINNDQRRVGLTPVSVNGTTYSLLLPADPVDLLPGWHMLFALTGASVPSVSRSLHVRHV